MDHFFQDEKRTRESLDPRMTNKIHLNRCRFALMLCVRIIKMAYKILKRHGVSWVDDGIPKLVFH